MVRFLSLVLVALVVTTVDAQTKSISVTGVSSPQGGAEVIPSGQFATARNHGGSWTEVTTRENGISNTRQAVFNGIVKTTAKTTTPILSGTKVVGFYRVWRFDTTFTTGNFTFTVVYTNPTLSLITRMNVK